MFSKLIAISVLFFLLLYLSNSKSMKEVSLKMMLSGETKVDDPEKEQLVLRKKIRWYTNGMIALLIGILGVGAMTIPEYIKWIIE